ncbi:hypothetical protein ACWOE5_06480 [Aerococcus sanguinicola]|uniref:Uncharacterized protein n=1 Tax=Aerococcus sanguinicola TaxID=119206 RepID=A0A0X8FAU3_9LACT|nr:MULTISPECIES: hypothetical protein [Aerococcus]AMB93769.1 hypothetical protein AWM72_02880 [Aerococcus sanguinicola]MDK7050379.1 hypothetical protein [Aerococcus sanguinicola]OFT94765.1 hypothetical protein HMPREF3090_05260 [Aerococcus sp. HMSC23C02]PKZ21500.1 hypothetical protein CYJ28_06215 [Aerococcus sanguinicola]
MSEENSPKKKTLLYLGGSLLALLGLYLFFQGTTPDLTSDPGNPLGLTKGADAIKPRSSYSAAPIIDPSALTPELDLKQLDPDQADQQEEAAIPPELPPTIDQLDKPNLDQLEADYEAKFGQF